VRILGVQPSTDVTPPADKTGLKPNLWNCDCFRDAEASLPLLKQGAPTDRNESK
jgi:hypothetical protein